jgi:hypothetical protein
VGLCAFRISLGLQIVISLAGLQELEVSFPTQPLDSFWLNWGRIIMARERSTRTTMRKLAIVIERMKFQYFQHCACLLAAPGGVAKLVHRAATNPFCALPSTKNPAHKAGNTGIRFLSGECRDNRVVFSVDSLQVSLLLVSHA